MGDVIDMLPRIQSQRAGDARPLADETLARLRREIARICTRRGITGNDYVYADRKAQERYRRGEPITSVLAWAREWCIDLRRAIDEDAAGQRTADLINRSP